MPADLPSTPPVSASQSSSLHTTGPATGDSTRWRSYRVQPGDTLYDLARTYDTTISALAKRNGIGNARWLQAGRVIEVPDRRSGPPASASSGDGSSVANGSTVTVRKGDTLWHFGRRYDVSVAAIVRANDLSDARIIHPGQKLTIPGGHGTDGASPRSAKGGTRAKAPSSKAPSTKAPSTVTVRAGDTLSHIAVREHVSLSALLKSNPGLDPRRLWVGQKVALPGSQRSTPSSPENKAPDTFLHYTYPQEVAQSAATNRTRLAETQMPSTEQVKSMIVATAKRHGVDPDLMLAISYTESGWNPRAVSNGNAIGVMQVIPSSGKWAGSLVGRELNLLNPQDNITAGTVIMRALLRSADSEDEAIGGYYQGLHGVQTQGMFPDTVNYVKVVKAQRDRF